MGLYRVFKRSIRFTFRNKRRFIVFLIIFGIVSSIIALNINDLDSLVTSDLLEQKGVTTTKAEGAQISYQQGMDFFQQVQDFASSSTETDLEASAIYHYADIDSFLRINSIEIDQPWMSDFANPSLLQSGSFPDNPNEILIPDGASQRRNISIGSQSIDMDTELATGQELTFINAAGDEIVLEIVGTFDISDHTISNPADQLWLFMDSSIFMDLLELFGMTTSSVYTYMTSYIVEGLILSPETHEKVDVLNQAIADFIDGNQVEYGDWNDVPDSLPSSEALQNANEIIVTLGFVVIGGIILSTLFAYLISRFRRREIAILKAMGYSHNAVRTTLLGELLTTSFFGFIIGLGIANGLLLRLNNYNFNSLIRFQATTAAFIIMVVISLPGMLLVSRRVLGVSPAEAFRDN